MTSLAPVVSRRPILLDYVESLGHKVFDSPLYDLNIIGIRSSAEHSTPDTFDDRICCIYRDESDQWITRTWAATTDPGIRYLVRPMNSSGCAAMAPGQYRGAYKIGTHRTYTALVQRGARVSFYRDNDRDDVLELDPATIKSGYAGLNIHRAASSGKTQKVGPYSAGCQVFQEDENGLQQLLELCRKQIKHHPTWSETFTYTLIDEPTW